ADDIFKDLDRRELLDEHVRSDGPAYYMRYDVEGWDKAVADGRPLYGLWLKFRRTWLLILAAFFLGAIGTALENRTVGLIDKVLDALTAKAEKAVERPAGKVGAPKEPNSDKGSRRFSQPA